MDEDSLETKKDDGVGIRFFMVLAEAFCQGVEDIPEISNARFFSSEIEKFRRWQSNS